MLSLIQRYYLKGQKLEIKNNDIVMPEEANQKFDNLITNCHDIITKIRKKQKDKLESHYNVRKPILSPRTQERNKAKNFIEKNQYIQNLNIFESNNMIVKQEQNPIDDINDEQHNFCQTEGDKSQSQVNSIYEKQEIFSNDNIKQ